MKLSSGLLVFSALGLMFAAFMFGRAMEVNHLTKYQDNLRQILDDTSIHQDIAIDVIKTCAPEKLVPLNNRIQELNAKLHSEGL